MSSAVSDPAPTRSVSDSGVSASPSLGGGALVSSQDRTTVADTVVQKIAGRAAREVSGVHDFGGALLGLSGLWLSGSRVLGRVRVKACRLRWGEKQAALTSTSSWSTGSRSDHWLSRSTATSSAL